MGGLWAHVEDMTAQGNWQLKVKNNNELNYTEKWVNNSQNFRVGRDQSLRNFEIRDAKKFWDNSHF
jgi:hypothetical protein